MENNFEFIFLLEEKVRNVLNKQQALLEERDFLLEKLIKTEDALKSLKKFYENELSKTEEVKEIFLVEDLKEESKDIYLSALACDLEKNSENI